MIIHRSEKQTQSIRSDRVPDELWMKVPDIVQETGIKMIPKKNKYKKQIGFLHSNGYIFPFLLCFSLLFFSQLFVRTPQTAILTFAFLFLGDSLDPWLTYNVTNLHPQFFRHSVYHIQSFKCISHFHCVIIRDLTQVIAEWPSSFPYCKIQV